MRAEQTKLEQNQNQNQVKDSSLSSFKELMDQWGEAETARVIADLQSKEQKDELTLAFCGHFSAGKSSMINKLCGSNVLPSGPVPTSANIVSIRCGEPRVKLYPVPVQKEIPVIPWETSPDQLQEYCRSGGEYSAIEVWEQVPILGAHGVLMDTPGVDSTDDGHQAATRSALHLADVVFYVMDYNHVQSENNLAFAKNLSDWGKPLYLIVNQIDKHRQQEITITEYRQQLESAFDAWGIQSAGLLFTSLKVEEHPLNQWEELLKLIAALVDRREELLQYSLSRSAHHIAETLVTAYAEEQSEQREQLKEETQGADEADAQAALKALAGEQEALAGLPEESRHHLRSKLDTLLGNLNLMPADVREAAGAYVESLAPGFRRGLLFTAGKREKEQEKRLAAWHSLQSREISGQLDWHLLQAVREWAEGLEVWEDGAETRLKESFPAVSREWLAGQVKPGTAGSGEALLNFCRALAAEIKAQYRRAALAAGDELLAKLPPLIAERQRALARREAALLRRADAAARLAALDRAADARAAALSALLPQRRALTPGALPGVRATANAAVPEAAPREAQPQRRAAAGPSTAPDWAAAGSPAGGRRRLGKAAAVLDAAAELLRGEPAMASAARSLAARAQTIAAGRFTLALFGAFSAGKSSFANALLGEDVLPVSPHPATAAVGRILAPEGEYRHGDALITMKSQQEFWDDIVHSFHVLQLPVPQRETWISVAANLQAGGLHPSALPHIGFLRAAAAGWQKAEALLGTVRTVDLQEYRSLVADETQACFIQETDLYYDCPLTASGIVLVDTPGADSLHARHTGVTFGYMKNADAICFVTYYNHAFSKADRGLLAQLGRIKDSFALDKMFFIINASDLAGSREELEEVKAHVAGNLRAGGLTKPRIYALSSLLALEGKTGLDRKRYEASRFSSFEDALARFAGGELPQLSLHAARDSIASVRQQAEEWRELAAAEAGRREAGLQELQARKEAAGRRLALLAAEERPARDLQREGEELIYHVGQRITFALGRFFQESFHPSLLREDARNLKEIFTACGRELERTLQRELEQELWATTLRLEAAGRRLAGQAALAAAEELALSGRELLENGQVSWAAPEKLEARLSPLDWPAFWSRFKSPRHFFEGPGRSELRAEAEPLLKEAVTKAAEAEQKLLLDFYADALNTALGCAASSLQEALQEREEAMSELLKGGDSAEHWSGIAAQLHRLEQSFGELLNNDL
ncbi:dynamin family protein [Paenibacillus typhae]|uniref:Dynamin family protein n=1 Tax=Paenibacillus typhae TaxID=1174501 RepID=A0A1G8PS24_9BACL|nr:dynamin family protein [Paenibacillus typhae]SDI95263.1 Dynamin family protein [Paenibacillus typhae]